MPVRFQVLTINYANGGETNFPSKEIPEVDALAIHNLPTMLDELAAKHGGSSDWTSAVLTVINGKY